MLERSIILEILNYLKEKRWRMGTYVASQAQFQEPIECGPLPEGLTLVEIDVNNPTHKENWAKLHRECFPSSKANKFEDSIVNHPVVALKKSWLVFSGEQAVGAATAGVYSRKSDVGVGHYIMVSPKARGTGLGKHLAKMRYRFLFDQGIRVFESETRAHCQESLNMHWSLGFVPKWSFDPWNTKPKTRLHNRIIQALELQLNYRIWQWKR